MYNGTKEQYIIEAIERKLNNFGSMTQEDYDNILIDAEEEFSERTDK